MVDPRRKTAPGQQDRDVRMGGWMPCRLGRGEVADATNGPGDLAEPIPMTGHGVDHVGSHVLPSHAESAIRTEGKGDDVKTRNLVRAASRAGGEHLVYISVVGADRVPVENAVDRGTFGYFAAKRRAEEAIAESGLPWTTLRATQFHESVLAVFQQMAKMPVMPVFAGVRFQPVAGGEVAERLADLAVGEPAGLLPDFAGPRVYGMDELARGYLGAAGKRRVVLPVRLPGRAAAAVRAGANLAPDRAVGIRTWEDHLAAAL
jgi:uncharacterized protein YbjT (DUF2867 family)